MNDLSSAARARVITAFGTLLYVDVASGELHHGKVESSPANAFFIIDQSAKSPYRRGFLVHDSGESCEPIVCQANGSYSASRADGHPGSMSPTSLDLVPLRSVAWSRSALQICSCLRRQTVMSNCRQYGAALGNFF